MQIFGLINYQTGDNIWQQINYNTWKTYASDRIAIFKNKVEPNCYAWDLTVPNVKCLKDGNQLHVLEVTKSSLIHNMNIWTFHNKARTEDEFVQSVQTYHG